MYDISETKDGRAEGHRLDSLQRTMSHVFPGGFQIPCLSSIVALSIASDPFLDASEESHDSSKVHIRVQQRNGRKCITTVAGEWLAIARHESGDIPAHLIPM
jgi:hypothetical protein